MDDLIEVCAGKRYKIAMERHVAKQFKKADIKEQARCLKWMKFFADDGFDFLDNEKLKSEGRFATGNKAGTRVTVWAFKAWQLRVYGGLVGDIFVATGIDTSKKQNAADRSALEGAARRLDDYAQGRK